MNKIFIHKNKNNTMNVINSPETDNKSTDYNTLPEAPCEQVTIVSKRQDEQKKFINFLENKLNTDIGFYYWKRYVAASFWAQLATPINLAITLMTALTTAEANSPGIISVNIYKQIAIATLVITTLNTFFRPYEKMITNIEIMKKWNAAGIEFEGVYYSDLNNNYDENESIQDVVQTITEYQKVQGKLNEIRKSEGPTHINFLTDFIHLIAMRTCLRGKEKWLDADGDENVKMCCCRRK
jgi:hypothetical protein